MDMGRQEGGCCAPIGGGGELAQLSPREHSVVLAEVYLRTKRHPAVCPQ